MIDCKTGTKRILTHENSINDIGKNNTSKKRSQPTNFISRNSYVLKLMSALNSPVEKKQGLQDSPVSTHEVNSLIQSNNVVTKSTSTTHLNRKSFTNIKRCNTQYTNDMWQDENDINTVEDVGCHTAPPYSTPISKSVALTAPRSESQLNVQCSQTKELRSFSYYHCCLIEENTIQGTPFLEIVPPQCLYRGQPTRLEWIVTDPSVRRIRIELMEKGSSATTIVTKDTANSGNYLYSKVPWGMLCGNRYFLLISCIDDPSRYITTDFFEISTVS